MGKSVVSTVSADRVETLRYRLGIYITVGLGHSGTFSSGMDLNELLLPFDQPNFDVTARYGPSYWLSRHHAWRTLHFEQLMCSKPVAPTILEDCVGGSDQWETKVALTEQQRTETYNSLADTFGQPGAEFLMANHPPGGWEQLATKEDLKEFATKQDLKALEDAIKQEFATKNRTWKSVSAQSAPRRRKASPPSKLFSLGWLRSRARLLRDVQVSSMQTS